MLLDIGLHQGASLHSVTPQLELRLLSVLSQTDAGMELEMLWQICSSLQRLGYPVAVLDGTARETDSAPGLEHLLAAPTWQGRLTEGTATAGTSSLAVIPAAHGLRWLAEHPGAHNSAALQRLHPLFRAYALVVLFAPPEVMAPLLRGSASIPLVMTGTGSNGVLQSYRQLKHMALHAGIQCTVASILPAGPKAWPSHAAAPLQTLQRCAERHLGTLIRTTTVRAASPQDIQRLALQLLENACTIDAQAPVQPTNNATETPAHFVRSH